jgi:hypothetical protein
MWHALGALLNSDAPGVITDQQIEALRRDLRACEPTEAVPPQHTRLTDSVTGCVTKGNYVQLCYDVTYVLLAVSASGKSSKGGAYEVVHRKETQRLHAFT